MAGDYPPPQGGHHEAATCRAGRHGDGNDLLGRRSAFYDAFAGYGNCIVDQASRLAGTRDDTQQVIDAAIAACSKQRDALRDTTIKGWAKFSMEDAQVRADAEVARSEAAFRNSALKAIQQARSPELAKRS